MEDDKKIPNGRREKKIKMADDNKNQRASRLGQNGRRQKNSKYSKLLKSLACAIWCKLALALFHILFLHTGHHHFGRRAQRKTTLMEDDSNEGLVYLR